MQAVWPSNGIYLCEKPCWGHLSTVFTHCMLQVYLKVQYDNYRSP